MEPPKTVSIEDTFRPAFEEISRRSEVASTFEEDETTFFVRSSDTGVLPFSIPGQKMALVSIGTSVLAPRPLDASRPTLRVYGTFATREEAVEHAGLVTELDPSCSLITVKMGEWILMPQNEALRDDSDANKRRCQEKLHAHRAKQVEDSLAFRKCIQEKTYSSVSAQEEEPEDKEEEDEAESIIYKPPKRIRAGVEVRGQSVVALCTVPDEYGECLFKILGCFENTADADAWVRNVGSRRITEDDICIAPCCEWLYPNAKRQEGKSHYRIDELQRIMDAADRNPEIVQSYKDWKKGQSTGQNVLKISEGESDVLE